MSKLSIYFGLLLAAIGFLAWVIGGMAAESSTALINVVLGLPIAACGLMAAKQPGKTKLYMHIAVALDVMIFLGAGSRIFKLNEFGSIKSVSIWATTVVSFILLGFYIQSFIKARSAKEG